MGEALRNLRIADLGNIQQQTVLVITRHWQSLAIHQIGGVNLGKRVQLSENCEVVSS